MSGEIRINITGNASGLQTAMNTVKNTTTQAMNGATTAINNTGKATESWAEKIRGSRGMIYAAGAMIGTITGVVFELETLKDAQGQVADSQEKLTELEKQGKQGTEEYSRAQQSLAKDARYLSLTTRNLALAFTNFIPEILMVVSMLAKQKVAANEAAGAFSNFSKVGKAVRTESTALNTVMGASNLAFGNFFTGVSKVKVPMQDLRLVEMEVAAVTATTGGAFSKFGALIGKGGPIMLAIAAIGAAFLAFIENWGGFRDAVNAAGVAVGNFIPQLKFLLDPLGKFGDMIAEKLGNKVPAATDAAGKGFTEMSKEAVKAAEDIQKAWEDEINKLEEMGRKDRLKWLKDLGFGKKGAKKIEFQIEVQEDRKQILDKMAEIMGIISKFKPDPKDQKVAVNNLIESLRDAMKDSKGQLDDLNPLLQILKDHKSDPDLPKYVGEWLATLTPAQIAKLKFAGIDVKELINKLGFDPAKLSPAIQTALGISVKKAADEWDPAVGFEGGGLDFGEGKTGIIDQFIQSIAGGLSNITPDKMKDAGAAIGDAIVSSITWTSDLLTPLWTNFVNTLKPLATPEGMAAVGTAIKNAVVGAATWTADNVKSFVIGFGIEVGKLINAESLASLGQHLMDAFVASVKWTAAVVQNIVIGLGIEIGKLLTPENLSAVGKALMDGIIGAAQLIGNLAVSFGKWLDGKLAEIFTADNLITAGTALLNGIFAAAQGIKNLAIGFATWLGGKLSDIFTVKNMAIAGSALLNAVVGASQAVKNIAVGFATWLGGKLKEIFTPKNMAIAGTALLDGMIGAAQQVANLAASFATWIAGKLGEIFTGDNLAAAGSALINGLIDAVKNVPALLGSLWQAILDGIFGKKKGPVIKNGPGRRPTGGGIDDGVISGVSTTVGVDNGGVPDSGGATKSFLQNMVLIQKAIDSTAAVWNKFVILINLAKLVVPAPNIDAFIKGADVVVKRLLDIGKLVATPIITVNNQAFIKGGDTVVKRLQDIGKMVAIPKIEVNIQKFIKGADSAVKRLQSINKMTATPKITVDIEKFIKGADTVVKRLQSINKMEAKPKISVTKTETTIKKTVPGNQLAGNLDSNVGVKGLNQGHMNVIIINQDEYSVQKKKKFRAELGRGTYRFG